MLHPHVAELMEIGVPRLFFRIFEMNGTLVQPHRCARFHSASPDTPSRDALGKMIGSRFGASATRHFVMSDMHETVEEGTRCDDHGLGSEGYPPDCGDAHGLAVLHEKLAGLVLPNVKVGSVVERVSPFPYKLSSVALCAWRPYGGTFAFVEHPELYGRPVGDHSHLSAHGVNLPHDLSLGDTANGRIAGFICAILFMSIVTRQVLAPMLAAAEAASQPACPPPMTMTS